MKYFILLLIVCIVTSCSTELSPPFVLVTENEVGAPYGYYVWLKDSDGNLVRYTDCEMTKTISNNYDVGDTLK